MGSMWIGKFFGVLIGLNMAGPFGAIAGLVIGHLLDDALSKQAPADWFGSVAKRKHTSGIFFQATFLVMGRLAKADGRVSQQEIDLAAEIMRRMGLNTDQKREAITLFGQGKENNFDVKPVVMQLREAAHFNRSLIFMFLEIQLAAALADGEISTNERALLLEVCEILDISSELFEQLLGRIHAERDFTQDQHQAGVHPQRALQDAYAVIGVSADVSDAVLKKAYRKLMSQHHPDKLVAKGLPPEMMTLAKEKTQEIQAAYELIKKSRA